MNFENVLTVLLKKGHLPRSPLGFSKESEFFPGVFKNLDELLLLTDSFIASIVILD